MIVSDLHLGKTGHFRKAGIAVPQSVYKADLQRLMAQLYLYKVERLIIVGDLTHSGHNKELDLFVKWRKDFSSLHVELVKGNHDILGDEWYEEAHINVYAWKLTSEPFLFLHDLKERTKLSAKEAKLYAFTGHLHPGITVKGRGRQALTFPCFYFAKDHCVLPAFSRFTGTYQVVPNNEEAAFAIVENSIMRVP